MTQTSIKKEDKHNIHEKKIDYPIVNLIKKCAGFI
jgi:hypothetical protein